MRLQGLHVLADDDPRWPWSPIEQARAACDGGASVIQLRTKHSTDRQTLAWATAIREITRRSGALFFVNDRFDLALISEADGVHVGQTDLPPDHFPSQARQQLMVGRSSHDLAQAIRARDERADYIAFGPIYETGSKVSEYDSQGLRALAEIVQAVRPFPVIAIGGINSRRAPEVVATGAAGLAVISAVADQPDPTAATRAISGCFPRPQGDRS
ncbi:thiamine phosphate synthase [Myxococcota bacterium]|nr:thiamine phosphate synthase [Myxococcota bacterium]